MHYDCKCFYREHEFDQNSSSGYKSIIKIRIQFKNNTKNAFTKYMKYYYFINNKKQSNKYL